MTPHDVQSLRHLLMANFPGMRGQLFVDIITFGSWWHSAPTMGLKQVRGAAPRLMALMRPPDFSTSFRMELEPPDPLQERDDAVKTYTVTPLDPPLRETTLPIDSHLVLDLGYNSMIIACEFALVEMPQL